MKVDQSASFHVPPERIVNIDIYNIPGAAKDFHRAWQLIQKRHPYRVLWSPCNGGHWIVTQGSDILRIYADHKNFSSRITIVPKDWGEKYPLRPTTLDPPEHRPYRRLLTAALTRAHVKAFESNIRKIIINAIDQIQPLGQCEFINDVAVKIPVKVFLQMAAIPEAFAANLPCYGAPPNGSDVPVMDQFANFLRPWVVDRQMTPGDDLLSRLVSGEIDGRQLSEDEAVDLSTAMLTGGIDTVISLLGFIMNFLAQNKKHCRQLVKDSRLIGPAVQEFIRRFPLMTKAREVKSDQELDGIMLKKGDMVVLPPLHGLDDRIFVLPLEVDFSRPAAPNASFGNGVHICPGSFLARTELEQFLKEWLQRIPEFSIQPVSNPKMCGGILGALLELKLQWNPSAS